MILIKIKNCSFFKNTKDNIKILDIYFGFLNFELYLATINEKTSNWHNEKAFSSIIEKKQNRKVGLSILIFKQANSNIETVCYLYYNYS